jgi:hypothetical protein
MRSKTKFTIMLTATIAALSFGCNQQTKSGSTEPIAASGDLDSNRICRSKKPNYPEETTLDARDAKAPARFEVKLLLKRPMLLLCLLMTRASVYQVHLADR